MTKGPAKVVILLAGVDHSFTIAQFEGTHD